MTADDVMQELEKLGSAQTRKTFARHGCPEPFFGVKVGDMKALVKQIGIDTRLAKQLYKTKNPDAQYFAGLIAHGSEFTVAELQQWLKNASWHMVGEYTVAWMAAEHPDGWDVALGWVDSPHEEISSAGWNALAGIVASRPDEELDLPGVKRLLKRIVKDISKAPNRTRYAMNSFVIAAGSSVAPLSQEALAAARKVGEVQVDMGDTACKVPAAEDCIQRVIDRGSLGKKRKGVKC